MRIREREEERKILLLHEVLTFTCHRVDAMENSFREDLLVLGGRWNVNMS
jgi:hypothetical protein